VSRSDFVRTSPADLLTTFCIAALWGGVWLMWPRAQAAPAAAQKPVLVSPTRYILRSARSDAGAWSPTLISLPSESGFSHALVSETEADAGRTLSAVRSDPAALLDRSLRASDPRVAQPEVLNSWPVRPVERYRPKTVEPPVFEPEHAGEPATVTVEPSQALREIGFALTGPPPAGWPDAREPWAVEAYVDLNAEGRVSHVFLGQAVSNEAVNAAVTEALRLGRVRSAGQPCSGTVTLSWPGKQAPSRGTE